MSIPSLSEQPIPFDIHASVIYQLGEALITDEIQALMELVKNCYDAHSTRATITVDTKNAPLDYSNYQAATGYILIEDDGEGMTLADIKRGWLTISNSIKRDQKKHPIPENRRTPLGDKGLGRLGTQRLGSNLEIWTRPKDEDVEYHVSFSWDDFNTKISVTEVSAKLEEFRPALRKAGTRLLISDLKDLSYWHQQKDEVQKSLSRMISPYEEVENFLVRVSIDGITLDLALIARSLRQTSEVRYNFSFDGETFKTIGKVKFNFFTPEKKHLPVYDKFLIEDNGMAFLAYLNQTPLAKDIGLEVSNAGDWYLEFSQSKLIRDIPGLQTKNVGKFNNPGSFHGEVDSFDLNTVNRAEKSVLDRSADFKLLVKQFSGIRVYRDGFAVRMPEDWLELGKQFTSGRSYYLLKPGTVIGYVAISARYNSVLEETTDREGMIDNAYSYNFFLLMQTWVSFTATVQEFLRRDWLKYIELKEKEHAGVAGQSPEELTRTLSENLAIATKKSPSLSALSSTLDKTIIDARAFVESAKQPTLFGVPEAETAKVSRSLSTLEQNVEQVQTAIVELSSVISDLPQQERLSKIIVGQFGALHQQVSEMYEAASLGMTTEALSHEIYQIADDLASQTRRIRQVLQKRNVVIAELVAYLERVDTGISALLKQLSHIAPSLRFVREKRQAISILPFFQEQKEFFKDRFMNRRIQLDITDHSPQEFVISMNKGKLVQIIDNLFLNSEYWLKEEIRLKRIPEGRIVVELDNPYIRISDNGAGIDPNVENSLFEAFITTKEKGKGRGLGLFIVQQLLDTEGAIITLSPERNSQNRLFRFDINLSSVLTK